MSISSRTGLVPTPQKHISKKKEVRPESLLPTKCVVKPISLSLRPFGGLYNPYAKGCSVLCNHPAPSGVRDVINQLKSSLGAENKVSHNREQFESDNFGETDNIPEDLFRRYTDTDSRPLTPSPTVTSVRTRNSTGSFLNNRRCITPELRQNEISKRKKIILDLRRSHSQETLYWKPTSEISQSVLTDTENKQKRVAIEKKVKKQKSEDVRPKTPLMIPEEEDVKKPPVSCINERDLPDEDVRRGKKRKKIKPQPAITTFHLSEDPETQVATLGPDSLNPSTRPSLIPNAGTLLPSKEKKESEPVLLKGSFLTDEAFEALKTELDVDTIENTFSRYLNHAMREAFKYISAKTNEKNVKDTYETQKLNFETYRNMPRKFSKSAARFEVPLNMKELETMSVFDYLSKYVWVSRQRKHLYKKVFLKHLVQAEEPDLEEENEVTTNLEYIERKMTAKNLFEALTEVLEFYGSEKNIKEILRIIDVDETKEFNFRTWCGIVSFGERLALEDVSATDSSDELEKADFTSMLQRLDMYKVPENLKEVFAIIRRGHMD